MISKKDELYCVFSYNRGENESYDLTTSIIIAFPGIHFSYIILYSIYFNVLNLFNSD